MLKASTFSFLTNLSKNNNKLWFDEHKPQYESAKADFEQFIEKLLVAVCKTDSSVSSQKAKDCIFRIYRDVRFGHDKTPYKVNLSAAFGRGGRKGPEAGYYMHVQPGKSFIAGGIWMPDAPVLKNIRQEIDYNIKDWQKILDNKAFKKLYPDVSGEKLKTLPKGYDADNPAIEYLKMKSFIVSHPVKDTELKNEKAIDVIAAYCAAMKPFIDFLNRGLD